MATAVVKMVGGKYMKNQVGKHLGTSESLYFTEQKVISRSGKTKIKKVKKELDPGLTPEEAAILKKAKKRAWSLDMSLFTVFGTRFGWDSVVGIVPGFGDAAAGMMALTVYKMCNEVQPPLSDKIKAKMAINIILDVFIGLVPVVGDIADGAFKCNTKNVALLEEELEARVRKRTELELQNYRHTEAASVAGNTQRGGPPPQYTPTRQHRQPEAAHAPPDSRGGRGWFGGRQQPDLEAGHDVGPPLPPRDQYPAPQGARY